MTLSEFKRLMSGATALVVRQSYGRQTIEAGYRDESRHSVHLEIGKHEKAAFDWVLLYPAEDLAALWLMPRAATIRFYVRDNSSTADKERGAVVLQLMAIIERKDKNGAARVQIALDTEVSHPHTRHEHRVKLA